MTWNYPYFTEKEMQCKGVCSCGGLPKDELMKRLVTVREEAGFPFTVSSGFRCPEYNAQISTTGENGPHTMGLAVDIKIYGEQAVILVKLALKHGFTGFGISQKGPQGSRFIHIDCIKPEDLNHPRPWIWSY